MTTNAFKSVVLLCAIVIATATSFAQQAVTRVEGKITDEISGNPVGCKIYVYNEAGKRVRSIRSNSADGTYLAVVNDAGKHKFVLAGHNVYRKEFFVQIPASTKFQEVAQDFTVKMFSEGFVLYEGEAFELNSAVMTPAASASLKEVIEAVTVNQQLNLNITVTVDQDQMAGMVQDSITKFLKDSIDWPRR